MKVLVEDDFSSWTWGKPHHDFDKEFSCRLEIALSSILENVNFSRPIEPASPYELEIELSAPGCEFEPTAVLVGDLRKFYLDTCSQLVKEEARFGLDGKDVDYIKSLPAAFRQLAGEIEDIVKGIEEREEND